MELAAPWEVISRLSPSYPAGAAQAFLVIMVPVWFYMAWYDMARLKILNGLVIFVFAVFVIIAPFLMPWPVYLGQLVQAVIVFAVILVLYAGGIMGGGDAKFIAAASPYFMREDAALVLMIATACCLGAYSAHRVAMMVGAPRLVPDWLSWSSGKRFPLGFALGGIVSIYLSFAAF